MKADEMNKKEKEELIRMKINDHRRIQLLWDEVNSQSQSKSQPPTTMQEGAKELLLEYAEELTLSIIESAGALAQSRGAKQIDDSDIALLLGKSCFTQCFCPYFTRYSSSKEAWCGATRI